MKQSPHINPFQAGDDGDPGNPYSTYTPASGSGDGLLYGPRSGGRGGFFPGGNAEALRSIQNALASGQYGQTALNQSQLADHRPAAQSFTPQLNIQGDPHGIFQHFSVPDGSVEVLKPRLIRQLNVGPGQDDDPIHIRYTQEQKKQNPPRALQDEDTREEMEAAHLRQASIALLRRQGYNPSLPIDQNSGAAAATADETTARPEQQASAGSSSSGPENPKQRVQVGKTAAQ